MNTILEQYQDKINGSFSFFDRMIIKGHIRQFFSPSGKKYFLSERNVLLKDFSAYANSVTDEIVSHAEQMTSNAKSATDLFNLCQNTKRGNCSFCFERTSC